MKQLRIRTIFKILFFIFLIFVALNFHRFFAFLVQDVGSHHDGSSGFDNALIFFPYYLWIVGLIYLVFVFFEILYPRSYEGKKKALIGNGIGLIALNTITSLSIIVKWIIGEYNRPIMKTATSIYPLDVFLWSLLFIGLGVLILIFGLKHFEDDPEASYYPKDNMPLFVRGIFNFLRSLYVIFAIYFVGDVIFYFVSFDFTFSHFAGALVELLLVSGPVVGLGLWLFGYKDQKDETKKAKFLFIASLSMIGYVLLTVGALFIVEAVDPGFLIEIGTPLFPVDHMLESSPAFGPIIAIAVPLLGAIIAFVHSLFLKKALNK